MSYNVNGINVTNFIGGVGAGTTNVSHKFGGFPTGWGDNRGIAKSDNMGYTIDGTDIGSYYRGIQYDIANDTAIDLANSPYYRQFKHVSSLLYGGGGGGGGHGGQGWSGGSRVSGHPGGRGGWGGHSYIRKTNITNMRYLQCNIANGGTGGVDGGSSTRPSQERREGGDGGKGNNGNSTLLYGWWIGGNVPFIIHSANGGNGGNGGPGGYRATVATPGNAGYNDYGIGGSAEFVDTNYLYRPGNDGTPGPAKYVDANNLNGNGRRGYAWLWFTYQK